LGAILYEMLTGQPAFLGETPIVTLEQVRSREPFPPRRLQPKVPRDLETICLKCMRKEAGRRYPTAHGLAEDVQRFLAGVPIAARPIPAWEKGLKLAQRHPAITALSALAVLLGALGMAGILWQWYRAEAGWRAAADRAEAEAEARRAADD